MSHKLAKKHQLGVSYFGYNLQTQKYPLRNRKCCPIAFSYKTKQILQITIIVQLTNQQSLCS